MRQQLPQFTIKTNLKQSEEFEDNHDNDNYSDYIEDVSVHTRRVISEWVCGGEDLSELAGGVRVRGQILVARARGAADLARWPGRSASGVKRQSVAKSYRRCL